MKTRRNTRLRRECEKKECEQCGLTFNKEELTEQNGYLVCPKCLDEPEVKD